MDYIVVVMPTSGLITSDSQLVESAVLPLCGTRKVIVTTTATTTTTTTTAAAYSSTKSTLGELLDNPATKAVLLKWIPDVVNNPQIEQGRPYTLVDIVLPWFTAESRIPRPRSAPEL